MDGEIIRNLQSRASYYSMPKGSVDKLISKPTHRI